MKILLFLCLIAVCCADLNIPDHLRAPLKILRQACVAETNVEEKAIDESKHGHLADVPNMGCYINCLLEHSGMVDDDGTIHFREVMHLLTHETRETVVYVTTECETIHGTDRCDTAFKTIQCYFKTAPTNAELP